MRRISVLLGLIAVVLIGAVLMGLGPILDASRAASRGRQSLLDAEGALRREDLDAASAALRSARTGFARVGSRMGDPRLAVFRHMPFLARSARSVGALAKSGLELVSAGEEASEAVRERASGALRIRAGSIDVAAFGRLHVALESAVDHLHRARAILDQSPKAWLLPGLGRVRQDAAHRLLVAERDATRGAAGADLLPKLVGAVGPRRYFVAVGNLSELRGSGGFIGYFAVVQAEAGKLTLVEAARPTDVLPPPGRAALRMPSWLKEAYGALGADQLWQSVNVPTDYPTTGDLIAQTVRQPGSVGPVDGVIQTDPILLSALLRLTGPVTVAPWPEPIAADNVAKIVQHDVYVRLGEDSDGRYAFLGRVVQAIASRVLNGEFSLTTGSLSELASAGSAGHLRVYASRPDEERELATLGLDGGIDRTSRATDVLGAFTENWTGTKIDWYLTRSVRYDAMLDPSDPTVGVRSRLRMDLHNGAPADGVPAYVIGPYNQEVSKGWNRQLVLILRSPSDELTRMATGPRTADVASHFEGSLHAYLSFAYIPPGGHVGVTADYLVPRGLEGGGRSRVYRLFVMHQPTLNLDTYTVRIRAPRGWEVSGPTTYVGVLDRDRVLEVRIRQTLRAWMVENLVLRPWRLGARLLSRVI